MNALQPSVPRWIYKLIKADAAHLAPHRREEGRLVPKVVIPHALPGTLQRKAPPALAFRKSILRMLACSDVAADSHDADDLVFAIA